MNLDELQSVQSRERQTDSLQQLRETFYQDAGEFVRQLRAERDRAAERADDPFDSPEVNRLTDDIKTAEQTVEAIYERRVGKVVKMASLAAADMPTEEEGLTEEERDLFETLVDAIEDNRKHVLEVLDGDTAPGAVSDDREEDATEPGGVTAEPRTPTEPEDATAADEPSPDESAESPDDMTVGAADVMGGGTAERETADSTEHDGRAAPPEPTPSDSDSSASPAEQERSAGMDETPESSRESDDRPVPPEVAAGADGETRSTTDGGTVADGEGAGGTDRRTVKITEDVGAILGVDEREYDLSADDVVQLPAENVEPLVERDAAEPLE